jgi:hypothetical protein
LSPTQAVDEKEIISRKYACTVVNLLPYEFREEKPHMLPAVFIIPAAPADGIAVIHVEEGIHYIPNPIIDEGKPGSSIKQTTPPHEMARSICEDYKTAHIGLGEDAEPGLFWVQQRLTAGEVSIIHAKLVKEARAKQNRWFQNLIAIADTDWNKNRNMLTVSDLQRVAARALGIKKEWVEMLSEIPTFCPSCKSSVHHDAVVCASCKYVLRPEEYKKMEFAK